MVSPLAQAIAFQNSVNPTQSGIAPTDVVGAYKLASDVAEKNYQAKVQQMMGLWGGLAALGGAGILGSKDLWAPALGKALGIGADSAPGIIHTGGAALGIPQDAFNAANAGLADVAPATGMSDMALPASGSIAADFGTGAPAAGSIAGDLAGTAGAGTAADLGGSVAADLGAAGATDVAASTAPDWLLSFLPFLA